MLSEEEIEKAKEDSKDIINKLNKHKDKDFIVRLYYRNKPIEDILQVLLQYIDQLEQENNKQNKIIDEMANFILDTDYEKNKNSNKDYYIRCVNEVKQYFEKKVEEK